MRDHSIGIPVPENTLRYRIPNACSGCHQDRGAKWEIARRNEWYGDRSRRKLRRRAAAFTAARAGDRLAIGPLLTILAEPAEGAVARANAAGHLSRFADDPRVFPALERALHDREPLVRAVAALRIASKSAIGPLIQALDDPTRAVRVGAVLSLVNLAAPKLSGRQLESFERARKEYVARAEIQSDDGPENFNVGGFHLLSGDPAAATGAFETSLRLDARLPARYFLARAYLQLGRVDDATRTLRAIPPSDAYFAAAQQLLAPLSH